MTETKEPKVTECFAEVVATQDNPEWLDVQDVHVTGYRPAILLWREDYDALRKELEELREYKKWHEMYKKVTAEAEVKEREHRKQLAVCKTWEQG